MSEKRTMVLTCSTSGCVVNADAASINLLYHQKLFVAAPKALISALGAPKFLSPSKIVRHYKRSWPGWTRDGRRDARIESCNRE